MKKIMILGGTGFVGKNVCECLQEKGMELSVVSRTTGVDLTDPAQTIALMEKEKPDFIVNCAAHVGSLNYVTQQAADVVSDNLRMILAIYEAVAKASRDSIIINPIANCAYPGKSETYVEDQWWDGHLHRSVLSYGGTRRMLWVTSESYNMQYGVKTISLLVPNMYGPFDSTDPNKAHALNALISKFVKAEKTGETIIDIWGTGIAIREWLYAKDFGRIVADIINNPAMVGLAEPLNIAQNFGLSVRELVDLIRSCFSARFDISFDPSKPDGAPKKVMDDRRFQKVFPGFGFTPLEQGVRNTIRYYDTIYPF